MKKENVKMCRLTKPQLQQKKDFIKFYTHSGENASSASIFDANANVAQKNIATMSAELHKDFNIQINRSLLYDKISEMFGEATADKYIDQLEKHEIYCHDESSLMPYCTSISMYPFLLNGTESLGGDSKAPQHLETFCGGFINLVFLVASQFAGAVATTEFLMYFDHFARKDFGYNYLETKGTYIREKFAQVVYTLNQPACARNFQSVFWNISIFDEAYFNGLFGEFVFPDDDVPKWNSVKKLQEIFMIWFNKERSKKILTFPVITATLLSDGEKPVNSDFENTVTKELSDGNSFFIYMSKNVDSLSSCCRLQNQLQENTFSYTLGAGGVATGSVNVITLNLNRFIQNITIEDSLIEKHDVENKLKEQMALLHKYQVAYRAIMQDYLDAGMMPVYDAGYITMNKQFLTIGINGLVESAEFMGCDISYNDKYKEYVDTILSTIKNANTEAFKEYGFRFNTEFVPAENLGVKNAQWDKKDGYDVKRDCYNSYFYIVEDENANPLDKFFLHGQEFTKNLDGGSALHLNLAEHLTQENYKGLLRVMAKTGCPYLGINVRNTRCKSCGTINKKTMYHCTECGSKEVSHITRVIGFIKEIPAFSEARQIEADKRVYHEVRAF